MSVIACKCDAGLSNTGQPNCQPISKVARKLILVPTFDDAGALNTLDLSSPVTQAVIDALRNQADKSKRWYPTPVLDNVEDVRADDLVESLNSGLDIFIQEGTRTFAGVHVKKAPALHLEYQSFACRQMSAFVVDKDGNLIGTQKSDDLTILTPIKIQLDTFKSSYIKPTDAAVSKVALAFAWDETENDGDLRMVLEDETTADFAALSGLLDVNSEISGITTTEFVAKLFTDYGTALNPVLVKGLVPGDFALQNLTDDAAVTILTAAESPEGSYTITFAAQDSADVLELTPTKANFDFSRVVDNTITIP